MNTAELIAALRWADPEGTREVWLEVGVGAGDDRIQMDVVGRVQVDEAGDVVIGGEGS